MQLLHYYYFIHLLLPLFLLLGLFTFSEKKSAEDAIRSLNTVEVAGRKLSLRMDRVQVPNTGSECNVYVGNLSFDIDNDQLLAYFQEFQPVSAEIARTSFGTARGFGIIQFSNPQVAAVAIERFNGAELAGRNIEVKRNTTICLFACLSPFRCFLW